MAVVTTTLEVGAVIVPVGLNKVAERKEPSFGRATQNGNAIERVERDKVTHEELDAESFPAVPGVWDDEKAKTGFHPIQRDLIDMIEAETKLDSFAVTDFIDIEDVPFERAVGCYFLTAQKGVNPKPLRLLYDALKATGKAGVFKLVLRSRQQPAVIYAKNGGLFVNTMVWAEDFTPKAARAGEQIEAIASDPKMLAVAVSLIEALASGPEALDALTDDLRPKRDALIAEALAGKQPTTKKKAPAKKVAEGDDPLMAALKASVADAGQKKAKTTRTSSKKAAVAA